MPDEITAQLLDGILVRTADGQELHCHPLTIAQVRHFQALRLRARDKDLAIAGAALDELVDSFPAAVGCPALADHIAPADVFQLLNDFFWCPTGARVTSAPGLPSTGTPSSPSSLPPEAA